MNSMWIDYMRSSKYKMKKRENMNHVRMDVSSYSVFDSLVQQYVIAGGPAISFDISDNVDTQSYGRILDDILVNNKNLDRLDKIENPRRDHLPQPIVSCYTVKEMDRVYTAIGPFWRVIMLDRPDYSIAKNGRKLGQMCGFQEYYGIIDHLHAREWEDEDDDDEEVEEE